MKPLWILVLAAFATLAAADVKVESIEYHGWKGSFRLSNGTVDLIVVPKIGRVIRYGYLGGPNLLWENSSAKPEDRGWTNFGGDRIWPAPQSDWNWPPEPAIDGAAWTAESIANGVRITSPVGKRSKVRVVREITLAPFGTEVRFMNRLDNMGARHAYACWQLTQVDDPYSIFLPTEPSTLMPRGWALLTGSRPDPENQKVVPGGLEVRRAKRLPFKVGAYSPKGEVTVSKGTTVFHLSTKVYPRAPYTDRGAPLQVYTNPDPSAYAEVGLLGPLTNMERGEGAILATTWRLTQGR